MAWVRQLVGGRHGRPEGHLAALVAVVEAALVEDHQQRVEDGTVGLTKPGHVQIFVGTFDTCLFGKSQEEMV